jgi:transmembrane sensor
MPIRLWNQRAPRSLSRWAVAACAIVAMGALAVIAAASVGRWSGSRGAGIVVTQIGENRSVRLADGSIVTLGGDSRVAINFHPRERDIDLLRGEAFFSVAENPLRPFKVTAGRAVIVDIGTQFDVRRDTDQVTVDVVEGRVFVTPRSSIIPLAVLRTFRPKLIPVFVGAGEGTTVDSFQVAAPYRLSDPEEATGWRSGRISFRMQSLGEVLQQVNRYSSKPIVISGPGITGIKVTGTVVGGNVSGWVASLHSALGIVAIDEKDRIVLQRAR